jgi:hypothetical protein
MIVVAYSNGAFSARNKAQNTHFQRRAIYETIDGMHCAIPT